MHTSSTCHQPPELGCHAPGCVLRAFEPNVRYRSAHKQKRTTNKTIVKTCFANSSSPWRQWFCTYTWSNHPTPVCIYCTLGRKVTCMTCKSQVNKGMHVSWYNRSVITQHVHACLSIYAFAHMHSGLNIRSSNSPPFTFIHFCVHGYIYIYTCICW